MVYQLSVRWTLTIFRRLCLVYQLSVRWTLTISKCPCMYGLSAVCQVDTYNSQMPMSGLSAVCQVDTYNFQIPLYGLSAVCQMNTYNFQMPLLFFLSMGVSVLFARIISVHLKINKILLSEIKFVKDGFSSRVTEPSVCRMTDLLLTVTVENSVPDPKF
jgi:hypothetical protein